MDVIVYGCMVAVAWICHTVMKKFESDHSGVMLAVWMRSRA